MNEYDYFKSLSNSVLTSRSLAMLETAVAIIQARYTSFRVVDDKPRYDSFPPPGFFDDKEAEAPTCEQKWVEYEARLMLARQSLDETRLPPSLWDVAEGSHLNMDIVSAYLGLLRARDSLVYVAEPWPLGSMRDLLSVEGRPAVIPVEYGGHWSFGVLYRDCFHWYDSGTATQTKPSLAREIMEGFPERFCIKYAETGPKETRPEDSGIFVLLGIRSIMNGDPQIGQSAADKLIPIFRKQILSELAVGKLDPDLQDLERLWLSESGEASSFFDDAIFGVEGESPIARDNQDSDAESHPEPVEGAVLEASTVEPPSSSVRGRAHVRPRGARGSRPEPQRVMTLLPRLPLLDHRRSILDSLSGACIMSRSTQLSADAGLAILWSCLQGAESNSEFHRRRNMVLFCNTMDKLATADAITHAMGYRPNRATLREMRATHSRFGFWRDLCHLLADWGDAKYVLLCAIPARLAVHAMGAAQKAKLLSDTEHRLADPSDSFRGDLSQARDLCDAIVANALPQERLMIDLYPYKTHEKLTDELYRVFVSLDPRVKLAIPR